MLKNVLQNTKDQQTTIIDSIDKYQWAAKFMETIAPIYHKIL